MAVIVRDNVVNSAPVCKVLDSLFLLSLNDPFLIQVAFLVTKKSQENHAVAITHNVEILAADTGWFFLAFLRKTHYSFYLPRFDQTAVEMHFAEVKMGIVSLG